MIYYINLTCDENNNISNKPYSSEKSTLNFSNTNSFYLTTVSQEETFKIIPSLINTTSHGYDELWIVGYFSRLALLE